MSKIGLDRIDSIPVEVVLQDLSFLEAHQYSAQTT